jgi:acetyltransferase
MTQYPAELEEHWSARTPSGADEPFLIRPIRPEDAAQHDAFFHRLTPEDIRSRFFAAVRELTPAQLARFTQPDYERDVAFIVVRELTGETVGVARLARSDDPLVAEFAVVVQSDLQGRGLAGHLMQRLLDWAPRHGLKEVVGEVLADNRVMLEFVRHLGFRLKRRPDDPEIVEARLKLPLKKPAEG